MERTTLLTVTHRAYSDILKMFQEWYPDRDFSADMELGKDVSIVDDARSLELLKDT